MKGHDHLPIWTYFVGVFIWGLGDAVYNTQIYAILGTFYPYKAESAFASKCIHHYTSYIVHHTSYFTHHTSYIIHHTSHIIHYTSYITHHTLYIIHHTYIVLYTGCFCILCSYNVIIVFNLWVNYYDFILTILIVITLTITNNNNNNNNNNNQQT